ncbi:SDR family NAD(P)-dependent oxidoreductase [Devosia naphthalenivorans]|uniref:SDR family NAD(P)-dependent oxidoreductase n=1 Tax=Devosia naphthalenivorans TaxID=2082392 RepID=UPI001FE36333|nr:SDR family oxidoreductase [Devosia naphthalenivorans]
MALSREQDMTNSQRDLHYRLDGQISVITGGASGIGLATAELLAAMGAGVVILDQNIDQAEAAAANIPGATALALDVTDAGAVEQTFDAVSNISILVNCAGIALRHPALEHPLDDWDRVAAVNVTGSFLCARAAARQMIAAARPGSIINTASIMGLSGGGLYPNISYQTTKGALVNMTRALAVEWAAHHIRVNAVAPTYVRTPFIAPLLAQPELMERIKDMTPLRRLAEPEEVAHAIGFLASPAAAMITGHTLPVDGGFLAR